MHSADARKIRVEAKRLYSSLNFDFAPPKNKTETEFFSKLFSRPPEPSSPCHPVSNDCVRCQGLFGNTRAWTRRSAPFRSRGKVLTSLNRPRFVTVL